MFDEGYEFPWDSIDMDIEEWWYNVVLGFKNSFEIYTKDGSYDEPEILTLDEWFDNMTRIHLRREQLK